MIAALAQNRRHPTLTLADALLWLRPVRGCHFLHGFGRLPGISRAASLNSPARHTKRPSVPYLKGRCASDERSLSDRRMPLFRNTPQLLLEFRAGKPTALDRVYRYYVRPVDTYLRALARFAGAPELSQPSAIADQLQEVFIRAFSENARLAYDGLREFSPYINTIARNCFFDALRKRRKEVLIAPEDLPLTAELAPEVDDSYDPKVVAVLEAYLRNLPHAQQRVYQQRFVLGLSQEAACEALGISRRTLRTAEEHLRRGLRKALLLAGALHLGTSPNLNTFQESSEPW